MNKENAEHTQIFLANLQFSLHLLHTNIWCCSTNEDRPKTSCRHKPVLHSLFWFIL